MPLSIGQHVHAELSSARLNVIKKLGEGTQGEVYLVEGPHGYQAVKWYMAGQATPEQRTAILYLVRTGPPYGPAGRRFIWPLDLVTREGSSRFGYLMDRIDTSKFAELGEIWAHIKPVPNFSALCEISYQLANSYRALHLSGHCYRDISAGNLMFNPESGDILICDNDNVGVNKQSRSQIWGTMEYMAPEIIRGEADPSTQTDLHSLAVLLFYLWVWHHPFHGEMEYRFYCWDIPSKKKVYGESPVFVFDPDNLSNRLPQDPDYETARNRWAWCPPELQAAFTRAFTAGLNPDRRVTEGEWQNIFAGLKDRIVSCLACRAENIMMGEDGSGTCWHCQRTIPSPPALIFHRSGKDVCVLLSLGTTIRTRHVSSSSGNEDGSRILGEVVPHPTIPGAAGIRNLSDTVWSVKFPDGRSTTVPPGRALPLNFGTSLSIGGVTAVINAPGGTG